MPDVSRPGPAGSVGTLLVHRDGAGERTEVDGDRYAAQVRASIAAVADRRAGAV